jgi:AraC family transcriptional regulator of adaptative response / DNA-3-methyladenine glycosylase II
MSIDQEATAVDQGLDAKVCRRARLSRDPRFDGEFYIAVRTTGIYCRPICPARTPAEKNVSYYRSAALAARDGYRPCLRCRPESAPNSPAWNGTSTTVQRALALIQQGALNDGSLAGLAGRLGIGERYLRKLFQRDMGVSPQAVALNQRLLFAKKLLAETSLPITEVAFAAGFGSVRRFNSAVKTQFKLAPGALRKQRKRSSDTSSISLQLQYRPPYDWEGISSFFSRHAIEGVESVNSNSYQRNIQSGDAPGSFTVRPLPGKHALQLDLQISDHGQLLPTVARVRRMFDLDANPAAIRQVLGQDSLLAPLLDRFEDVRSLGHWSLYESAFRGIVGQQVSTRAARSVIARLAKVVGDDADSLVFPPAAAIASLDDGHFPMPGRRRDTLRQLCLQSADQEDELELETVTALKGVGPWTTAMVSMRGDGQADTFPLGDLGLEKAWSNLGGDKKNLKNHMANWRPWGSYAANLLWRSLSA